MIAQYLDESKRRAYALITLVIDAGSSLEPNAPQCIRRKPISHKRRLICIKVELSAVCTQRRRLNIPQVVSLIYIRIMSLRYTRSIHHLDISLVFAWLAHQLRRSRFTRVTDGVKRHLRITCMVDIPIWV